MTARPPSEMHITPISASELSRVVGVNPMRVSRCIKAGKLEPISSRQNLHLFAAEKLDDYRAILGVK